MRLRHSNRIFCDGCFLEISRTQDSFIVFDTERNKHVQVCGRCFKNVSL